jgi:hypothetical protein
VQLNLYCDDSKAAEIRLLNLDVRWVDSALAHAANRLTMLVVTAPSGAGRGRCDWRSSITTSAGPCASTRAGAVVQRSRRPGPVDQS